MVTHRNTGRYVYIQVLRLLYAHIFPCHVSGEGLEATMSQYQKAHVAPRSWFLMPFLSHKRKDSLEKWLIVRQEGNAPKTSSSHPELCQRVRK